MKRIKEPLPALKACTASGCYHGAITGISNIVYPCFTCGGLGAVVSETGAALPEQEIINQLVLQNTTQAKRINDLQLQNNRLQRQLNRYERTR